MMTFETFSTLIDVVFGVLIFFVFTAVYGSGWGLAAVMAYVAVLIYFIWREIYREFLAKYPKQKEPK